MGKVNQQTCQGCPAMGGIAGINLDQMQFKYRAEGNANLVLALPQTRQVLRLKKTQIGGDVQQQLSPNAVDSNYCALIEYIRAISGLFSSCFIIEPQLVFCVLKDLDVFNKQLNMVRPVDRLSKVIRYPFGIIYPDVTFLPKYLGSTRTADQAGAHTATYCVEIKPKQGWSYSGNVLEVRHFQRLFQITTNDQIKQRCRYCAMQFLKCQKGKIQEFSKYCPMDLFSGNMNRMLRAISNLIDCPQNNLRIFKDGRQIYGTSCKSKEHLQEMMSDLFGGDDWHRNMNKLAALLSKTLLHEYTFENSSCCNVMRPTCWTLLPRNSILKRILDVQLFVYDFFMSLDTSLSTVEDMPTLVLDALGRQSKETLDRYCYGATTLDCSLMITFRREGGEGESVSLRDIPLATTQPGVDHHYDNYLVQQDGRRFMTKISIMDLDPKPSTKHAIKYIDQTAQAYRAASSSSLL